MCPIVSRAINAEIGRNVPAAMLAIIEQIRHNYHLLLACDPGPFCNPGGLFKPEIGNLPPFVTGTYLAEMMEQGLLGTGVLP